MKAVSQGQVVDYQGKGTGRPIFEVIRVDDLKIDRWVLVQNANTH